MSWWEQKMSPRTRHMLAGGAIGAIGIAAIYSLFRSREAVAAPAFHHVVVSPPHESEKYKKHKKHKHHDHHNDRGEYGHKHKGHPRES